MQELKVWAGPMASAKTTGALHAARRYQRLGKTVCLVRPARSIRAHEKPGLLVTKNGESFPSIEVTSALDEIWSTLESEVVWVDEPFLFEDEIYLYSNLKELRIKSILLVSSIGSDCEGKPFGHTIPQLLAAADEINWCFADCDSCGAMGKATRTLICKPYVPGELNPGGVESYSAACPACWNHLQNFPPEQRRDLFRRGPP